MIIDEIVQIMVILIPILFLVETISFIWFHDILELNLGYLITKSFDLDFFTLKTLINFNLGLILTFYYFEGFFTTEYLIYLSIFNGIIFHLLMLDFYKIFNDSIDNTYENLRIEEMVGLIGKVSKKIKNIGEIKIIINGNQFFIPAKSDNVIKLFSDIKIKNIGDGFVFVDEI